MGSYPSALNVMAGRNPAFEDILGVLASDIQLLHSQIQQCHELDTRTRDIERITPEDADEVRILDFSTSKYSMSWCADLSTGTDCCEPVGGLDFRTKEDRLRQNTFPGARGPHPEHIGYSLWV